MPTKALVTTETAGPSKSPGTLDDKRQNSETDLPDIILVKTGLSWQFIDSAFLVVTKRNSLLSNGYLEISRNLCVTHT